MALPKWATTITIFSKYLALAMLVIFPVLGFYWGRFYQSTIDANKQATVKYILVPATKTKPPTPSISNIKTCTSNTDCATDEYCAVSGPLIYNPEQKKTINSATCHKKNTVLPM